MLDAECVEILDRQRVEPFGLWQEFKIRNPKSDIFG